MALNLTLSALIVPSGTEFPGNVQDFLAMIEQYMEIAGGADFDGVNYGSVEPSPDDRDKAWFKTDGSGTPLGWYAWNGSAWQVIPGKAFVGSAADRDAISSPQDGTLFHVVGTGLYTFVNADNAWEPGFPAAEAQQVYDRTYLFASHQLAASTTSESGGWVSADIASLISAAGLTTVKAVLVRLESGYGLTSLGNSPQEFGVAIRATQDNTNSTSSTALTMCNAIAARDDSRAENQANTFGMIPVGSTQTEIYYCTTFLNSPPSPYGRLWVTGFLY